MPFMLGALIFMTVFFLVASLLVFYDFRRAPPRLPPRRGEPHPNLPDLLAER